MGLMNNKLVRCPFTGVEVATAGDPSMTLDGISYFGNHLEVSFPIRLSHADPWATDPWLVLNGPHFIGKLAAARKLDRYFIVAKTLANVKHDYLTMR